MKKIENIFTLISALFTGIIISTVFYSCNKTKKVDDTGTQQKVSSDVPEELSLNDLETHIVFNYMDSLYKYSYADSIIINPNHPRIPVLYIAKVNNVRTAVFINRNEEDYTQPLYFMQYDGKKWQVKDTQSFDMDYPYIRYYDLNGDKFTDIKIGGHSGNNNNSTSMTFLYDPASGSFNFNPHYNLENLKYNATLQRVTSYYFGDDVESSKYVYRVTGDSLTLDKSIILSDRELSYYRHINGKEILLKKRKGEWDTLWEEFIHAYWYTPSHADFESHP